MWNEQPATKKKPQSCDWLWTEKARKILWRLKHIKPIVRLQFFWNNSLFKFGGLGIHTRITRLLFVFGRLAVVTILTLPYPTLLLFVMFDFKVIKTMGSTVSKGIYNRATVIKQRESVRHRIETRTEALRFASWSCLYDLIFVNICHFPFFALSCACLNWFLLKLITFRCA